jgi:hypothetical protein
MSHHYSYPDSIFPHGDARLDLTDLYAFPKPAEGGKSILIMNLHPSVGENPRGPTTAQPFAPEALYEMPSPISRTGCASRRPRAGRRSRRCAALTVRRPPQPTMAGRLSSRGHQSRRGGRHGSQRPATTASSRVGAAIPSSSTGGACFLTACSLPATISSPTRTCAASCSRCPTLPWGANTLAYGTERWSRRTARAGVGSRWSAARGPCNSCSSSRLPAGRKRPTSLGSRATMPASRTRWSTRVDIRPRKRGGWRGQCCPRSYPTTPRARRPSRVMGRTLTDDAVDVFLAILTNGKVTEDKVGPHGDLLAEFPYLGPPHNA